MEEVKIAIAVGSENRDYSLGDFINALDELTSYFHGHKDCLRSELSKALRFYADTTENL